MSTYFGRAALQDTTLREETQDNSHDRHSKLIVLTPSPLFLFTANRKEVSIFGEERGDTEGEADSAL